MSAILLSFEILLFGVSGVFTLYLFVLSVCALCVRLRKDFPAVTTRRFAFVIPAHNEERCIEKTLASVMALDYPRAMYDAIVIADNCDDATASLAGTAGAIVWERHDHDRRGKGYALRWCFDRLLAGTVQYDAVVVVDADSVVDTRFLRVMNHYLASGARAIQSSDLVAPQPGVWSAEATRLGFVLYNYVRPLGRGLFNGHAGARGNGMCFATDVLREVPWTSFSRNEDLEYGLMLLLNGIPIRFAPEALVLATMPANPKNAESQRARWEGGRFPVIRRMAGPLLRAAIVRHSFVFFDAFIELVTPALVNLLLAVLAITVIHGVLYLFGVAGMALWLYVWLAAFILGVSHVAIGLLATGDRSLLVTLAHIPRYVVWKFLLYGRLSRKKTKGEEWVRTERE